MPIHNQRTTPMPQPIQTRPTQVHYDFQGYLHDYLRGVSEQWLKVAPTANPAMLEMLRDRDRQPYRDLVPWAGEFAGKYLTAATQVLRLTADEALRDYLASFVDRLTALQSEDGYLGPWPRGYELTGSAPQIAHGTWDAWGHYHILLGLLLWHEESGDEKALDCARRIGDLFCARFLGATRPRLVDTGSTEMNLAPVHALALLRKATGEKRYLDLALQIVDEFAAEDDGGQPLAGDYLRTALAGQEFFETPKPRWESLHPILGLAELYYLTGDRPYRQAFEHWWWSIVKLDRHNNGGFSSGEQAQGNPYHPGAIETCCTIAWIALSVEMLRLTGNSIVADELELATINSVVGLHSVSGRWATYNTPMDGVRKASAHDIVFQARAGSPELNCCSVNAARGFGLISDWALMHDEEGLILNGYGPGTMTTQLPSGAEVRLVQMTDYPRTGVIRLHVEMTQPQELTLKVRIPSWSVQTGVKVNGEPVAGVTPGSYLRLHKQWMPRDVIEIDLDFSLHYWVGEEECIGLTSLYRGPVLLTYDRRFNDMDPADVPSLDARTLAGELSSWQGWLEPVVLWTVETPGGHKLNLCDFGSAGEGGTPYRSWLPVEGVESTEFSRSNPLRSGRAS
jgi:uncharacterized protein